MYMCNLTPSATLLGHSVPTLPCIPATEPTLRYSPNAPVLSCTPAHVGHVWGGGNAFNSTLTAGPHLGGLKGVKIVKSDVAILCPCEQ